MNRGNAPTQDPQRNAKDLIPFSQRISTFFAPHRSVLILGMLFFVGALFWAREQDPFTRKWFSLKTDDGRSFQCVVVLPKPVVSRPLVVYAHGSGGSLMNDGNELRQLAELGLAVVSLEYNQTNHAAFGSQFETLLDYLARQKWVDTNAIAWVGFSSGANQIYDFALRHPVPQPQLLVQLSGGGIDQLTLNSQLSTNLHCPLLLIHGDQDEIFAVADTRQLAAQLQANGVPVTLEIMPGLSHGIKPERGVVYRSIGEYCFAFLNGRDAWQNYHSIAHWQAEAPPFWLFQLPALAWIAGWLVWRWKYGQRSRTAPPVSAITRGEMILRWLAVFLAVWGTAETALHLVPPQLTVNERTLAIARKILVQPKQKADFEFLAAQPIWSGQKLKVLLDHVELAGYNCELVNWQLADQMYQDFVLSPVITGNSGEQLDWRRPLWEEFYPRIRHENSPTDAARIVVRHLRERVTIATLSNPAHEVPDIWLRQITDRDGFQVIYVAALRSVGVPARVTSGQAEYWDGNQWQTAPEPAVKIW
jgi:acetyl esterase/lipase